MNDISSLPPVNASQMAAMMKKTSELQQKDGFGPSDGPVQHEVHPAIMPAQEPEHFDQEEAEPVQEEKISIPLEPIHVSNDTEQAQNFRAIKEKAKQLERERDEALKIAKQALEKQKNSNAPSDIDYSSINPDDLVEGKHLNKVAQEMQAIKQQLYVENQKARLRVQYPDFEKVVNRDNIETFELAYPELAASLNSTQDIYSAGVSAYTLFKKFGISGNHEQEKEVVNKNMGKPRPLTSVSPQQGESPMSRANAFANGLTTDLKKQLWEDMKKNRG